MSGGSDHHKKKMSSYIFIAVLWYLTWYTRYLSFLVPLTFIASNSVLLEVSQEHQTHISEEASKPWTLERVFKTFHVMPACVLGERERKGWPGEG